MKNTLLLLMFSILVFLPGNDILSLTNPDEVFYAQTAREMVQHHSWNVPYLFGQPQFEKPILTYWLIRVGYLLFGETSFGARFFPALFSIIGVFSVYWFTWIGYKNKRKAWLSALILMSSGLYVGLGRMVFTDTIFSVLILLSMTTFFWAHQNPDKKNIGVILSFVFSALAVLTKGPLGFLIPALVVVLFLGIRKEWNFLYNRALVIGFLIFIFISLPWYLFVTLKYGMLFIKEFFYNDHIRRLLQAEHPSNDRWYFYPITMFGCMFPWTLIVLGGFIYYLRKTIDKTQIGVTQHFVLLWVAVVFGIFQVAHSKLVSYIVPLFPALAIMAGDFLDDWLTKHTKAAHMLLLYSTLFLFAIPALFIWGLLKYPMYLPPQQEVIGFIIVYLFMITTMLVLLRKGRIPWNISLLASQVPIMLVIIFMTHANFEEYTTSKNATDYLLQNYNVNGQLICTKIFLRGTRYFTDKDIVALTMNGSGFFSPHPITHLNTETQALAFFKNQSITYGFVSKSYWQALQRLTNAHSLQLELLKIIGDQYVIRIKS